MFDPTDFWCGKYKGPVHNGTDVIFNSVEQLQEERSGYLQLKEINGLYFAHRSTNVWAKETKKPKKISEHLGAISMDGKFPPKTPQTDIPATYREIFQYTNAASPTTSSRTTMSR